MKYLIFLTPFFSVIYSYSQKNEKYIYINSNIEFKNKKTNTNFDGGEQEFLKLLKIEPVIGYGINSKKYTFNIGFIIYGWSKYWGNFTTKNTFAEKTISTSSYGLELSYIFKLYKNRNKNPFTLGFGINFNYQYVLYNRKLDGYFTVQDDIHINENLTSSVLSSGLLILLEQELNKTIAINFNIGNRFYLPFNNSIYNYSNNHYLISLGVKYKF